jgi:hypothetical protein
MGKSSAVGSDWLCLRKERDIPLSLSSEHANCRQPKSPTYSARFTELKAKRTLYQLSYARVGGEDSAWGRVVLRTAGIPRGSERHALQRTTRRVSYCVLGAEKRADIPH